ncbi:MAG: PfkB family carbohydrate kinase [Treponema sp.]|jgi:sugar/nucleoside kinase (ribokinase family)|nr:PfkB family carbohydrate kinase [Treponema sp.]
MSYLAVSTAVIDTIYHSESGPPVITSGGAGLYAYSGIRLWAGDVYLVCGRGNDFSGVLGPWFRKHGVSTAAMFPVDAPTPQTVVRYLPGGERIERPHYGAEHYRRFTAGIDRIAPHCSGCRGMYLFSGAEDTRFWDQLGELKGQYRFTLLWEISADSAVPEKREQVLNAASRVDILSINRTEAARLFSGDEETCIRSLASIGLPLVFYRRGNEGALMLHGGQRTAVAPAGDFDAADPTGAGNSSSGAVLAGYCQGLSPRTAGLMGSIAAGFTIAQHGPAPVDRTELREKAVLLLKQYETAL